MRKKNIITILQDAVDRVLMSGTGASINAGTQTDAYFACNTRNVNSMFRNNSIIPCIMLPFGILINSIDYFTLYD